MDGDAKKLSQEIIDTKPDIIFVAFGCPKQEEWIAKYKNEIPSLKVAIGIGCLLYTSPSPRD